MKARRRKPRSLPPLAEFDWGSLPSLTTYRKELFWLWNNERGLLGLAALQFFAGLTFEEAIDAEWEHINAADRTIRCPLSLGRAIRLNTGYDWLLTLRPDPALGLITPIGIPTDGWFRAVRRFQEETQVPWSMSLMRMYRPHHAYCAMPMRPEAINLKGYWGDKVRLYKRRGEQLQKLTPNKVLGITRTILEKPSEPEPPLDSSELDLI